MSHPTRIALLGFTHFERTTIESFIRLSGQRDPAYVLVDDACNADLALADADDDRACAHVQRCGLMTRAVLLGGTARAGGALQLPRPINLGLVMRALDEMPRAAAPPVPASAPAPGGTAAAPVAPAGAADDAPPAGPSEQVQRVLEALAYRTGTLTGEVSPRDLARSALSKAGDRARRAGHAARESTQTMEHVLIVDDDERVLRFAVEQLQRLGFQLHLASSAGQAWERLAERRYQFIFVDPALEGLDGLAFIRAAKEEPATADSAPARVVLLADALAPPAIMLRVLPAADGCLRTPLREVELRRVVGERDAAHLSYADTTYGASRL